MGADERLTMREHGAQLEAQSQLPLPAILEVNQLTNGLSAHQFPDLVFSK